MFVNKQLIKFIKGNEGIVIHACILDLLLAVIGTGISICMAIAIRMILGDDGVIFFNHLYQPFICVAIFIIIRYFSTKEKLKISNMASIKIKEHLRIQLLENLFEIGPSYSLNNRTGDIANTISNKVERINNYYIMYLPAATAAIINSIGILIVLLIFDWVTALICLLACIGMLGSPMLFYGLMKERGKKEWEAHSAYYADCLDSIQGITTLKAFNANEERKLYMNRRGEDLREKIMSQLKITMLETGLFEFFVNLGSAFAVAVIAVRFIEGAVSQNMLIYTLFLAGACFAPMLNLGNAWHLGYQGITASYSIEELLNEKSLFFIDGEDGGRRQERSGNAETQEDILFSNVSFAYNQEEGNVLNNITFSVPSKNMTALVGSSGSGKSTIAHLLAGFYPVTSGEILVGGERIDINSIAKVQDLISAVWQDSHIFYGTVYDNISLGKSDATKGEVIEAAKKARIHDFIEALPNGYQTFLGEDGMRFSGGERQRIALARAFLKNSPIIIFDEATSSLDRENEIEIQRSFNELRKGKTALVIAHRLSTIEDADQICILENGEIVGFGTHEELRNTSSAYQSLMGVQFKEEHTYGV